eukprot:Nitzschia sp. Nitz4//scaffold13_size275219//235827//238088//NITZ4_000919-RA/size275219-processed-gene-0.167-mRNA-1//-1//CDS//3329536149//4236//frame0
MRVLSSPFSWLLFVLHIDWVTAFLPVAGIHGLARSSFQPLPSISSTVAEPPTETLTFDQLKRLESRISHLEESMPNFLMDFYEPHLSSFSISPGVADTISITSSCYAVRAMLASENAPAYKQVDMSAILKELIHSSWRSNDLYQVSLLLVVLLRVDKDRSLIESFDAITMKRVSDLITLALKARPRRRFNEQQAFSDYITYLCTTVFASLFDSTGYDAQGQLLIGGLPPGISPKEAASELSLSVLRSAEVSFNELCRQLAYRSAKESSLFDPTRLAYSLLTYIRATQSLEGTAGRERVIGEGPDDQSRPARMNRKIVKAALSAFFDEQREDGLWERGQPIYKSFRRQGRNVGNAYVFAVDTIGSMLEILPAEDFRPHLPKLQKMLDWIESNQAVELIPDYCDSVSGQCYGKPLRGWASPHLPPGTGPKAWSTAQTATCIHRFKRVVQQLMNNDVLEEFNGIAHSVRGPLPAAWDRLLDSDLGVTSKSRTIKSVLEERICTPFATSVTTPSVGAAYSAILFGSPGTAKTTISEAVAEKMGWDFVVIDTAAFLADGLTNVANRIRYVFTRLQALRKCVILFDEIEEFCLDRESPGISMESRMLTTAMLTAINDLRRTKQSVFFLATNRLRAFDAAIIRPGRFDIQLFVGTPNLEARAILFDQALTGVHVTKEERASAIKTYRRFLESVWSVDGEAMFMNYLEGKQFATAAANIVAKRRKLEEKDLQNLLEQQAMVMTCRGAVRDEYKVQMELSRL